MDAAFRDIRYAVRLCVRTPGFTAVAVLALALGIGANTAIFTIVNAVLIEPLPFRDASRIVTIWEANARRPNRPNTIGPANFLRWQVRAHSFEAIAGVVDTRTNLTGTDRPEELTVQNVTAGFFRILGTQPLLGRTFTDDESEDPDAAVTVLTYELWQRRFAGDAGIIGRTIRLNDTLVTVVGVMPQGTHVFLKSGSLANKPADLWKPWVLPSESWVPRGRFMSAIARLKPDVTLAAAQTEMKAVAAGLSAEFPEFDTGWSTIVRPIRDDLSGDVKPALLTLSGAVAFVLLIACANVANLLLARGATRQREIAIRAALGAPRGRVIRQLLTESFVLAALGGALGLLFAGWGIDLLVALSPVDLTTVSGVHVNRPVLAFTALASLVTAIACGLAPAFEGSRADVQETLKDGTRQVGGGARHRRMRHTVVIAEIALAVVLLVGAGLMLRSLDRLRKVDTGFQSQGVLTMRLSLPPQKYERPDTTIRFYQTALDRVRQIPGVRSAGEISFLPFAGLGAATDFRVVGRPVPPRGQEFLTDVRVCDNGYFETLRIPLLRGRLFTPEEMQQQRNVVIVNEALVKQYFASEDPIGKQLIIDMKDDNVPTTIVGIVGTTRYYDLSTPPRAMTFWPHPQLGYTAMTLVARTTGDPLSFAPAVTREIQSIDKDQPVSDVRTMDQWIARSVAQTQFTSLLLASFAALALLLAAIGIYGVISYAVSQRTSEIGIRLAIGADKGDIMRMILGNGARLAGIGLAIGVALALALTRTVTTLLYETSGTDPVTFSAVVAVLGCVAILASYLPARRAARIPPVDALRYQ